MWASDLDLDVVNFFSSGQNHISTAICMFSDTYIVMLMERFDNSILSVFCLPVHNRRHEAATNQQTQQPAPRRPAHHSGGAVEGLEDL